MDKLSRFLVETFQPTPPQVGSTVPIVEPTFLEKRAYGMAMASGGSDMEFLKQFEGTPLAPQAVALAEQELAMEQQQLQKRMQRTAERKMDDTWDQDCIQQDGIRLQKQQLLLQLYKMKAMTPAPQPGDATIGTPPPAPPQLGAEIGSGTEAGAPVMEQGPKLAAFVRSFMKKAAPEETGYVPRDLKWHERFRPLMGLTGGAAAGTLAGSAFGAPLIQAGHPGLGALAMGIGGSLGAVGGATLAQKSLSGDAQISQAHMIRKSLHEGLAGIQQHLAEHPEHAEQLKDDHESFINGIAHMDKHIAERERAHMAQQGPKLASLVHLFVKRAGPMDAAQERLMTLPGPNKHFARSVSPSGSVKTSSDKKAAISKFARRMKQANAVTSAEQGLASLVAHRPPPMPISALRGHMSSPSGLAAAAEGIASRAKGAVPISSLRGAVPPPIPKTMPSGAPVLHRMSPQTSGGMAMKAKREAEMAAVEAKLMRGAA